MRRINRTGVLWGALAAMTFAPAMSASDDRPNFILFMADDQGWGDVGYNGEPVLQTPVLDEMAASGLRFDRFYSASSVCSPTRGSVMTGRHPNRFGCFSWGHSLRPQEVTVAEVLKDHGYATGHFGKWHLGSARAESLVSPGKSGFTEWFSSPNFYENDPLMSHNGKVVRTEGEGSIVTADAAIDFIRSAQKENKPFLAVVWFGSPHTPHEGVDEFLELYPDQPERLQHYYAEITAMDYAVGKLRKELRELDIADDTLVWYTSDNGPQGPENRNRPGSTGGLSGRKGTLWEGGIRVPTIIEWPAKIDKPRAVDFVSGTVDIYPTLLELAGAKVKEQPPLDGVSLVGLIEGKGNRREAPLAFWDYPERGQPVRSHDLLLELQAEQKAGKEDPAKAALPDTAKLDKVYSPDERPGHAAWMAGDHKLHRIPIRRTSDFRYALYDIAKDPTESEDLAEAQPERLKEMKAALEDWQRSVIASLNGDDY